MTTLPAELRNLMLGLSQIYLQENWITGVLIGLGVGIYSVPMGLVVLLGTLVATGSARLVGVSTAHGLQGYCGALVGAASWVSLGTRAGVLATLLGAAACPVVTAALATLLARVARSHPMPVLTAPFCVISGLIAVLARWVEAPAPIAPRVIGMPGGSGWTLIQAILTGAAQVVLVDSWIAGVLILVGLAIAGWRIGLAALIGATLGTLTAWVTGSDLAALAHGLAGFNPLLTAVAVVVFLRPGWLMWGLVAAGSVATVGMQFLVGLTPIPGYTWPFIVTTWLILLIWDKKRV